MNSNNPGERFDLRLKHLRQSIEVPYKLTDAAIYVNDTMEIAWIIAEEVLGTHATAETAIAIYDRIDRERLRLVAEARGEKGGNPESQEGITP